MTTLGLRASHDIALSDTIGLTARGLRLEPCLWRRNPGGKVGLCWRPALHGPGLPVARDTGIVEAGFAVDIGKSTTLGLTYIGQFSNRPATTR